MNPALLEEITKIFSQSTYAYRNYLAGGKTFRFAQELKLFNGAAFKLLIDHKSEFAEELQPHVEALIGHYRAWSDKWEELASSKEHQPDDEFVFANEVVFPKEAAQQLEAAYERLNPPPATPSN